MPLAKQTVHIPFVAGVETRTDPRIIQPPKLAKLEHAIFEEPGSVKKRPGTVALALTKHEGGTITAARQRALGVRGDELLLFAEGKTWSWSDKAQKWFDRGRFDSVLVDQRTVAHSREDQVLADRAEAGSVIVYAWQDTASTTTLKYQVVDKVTRAIFTASATASVTNGTRPKCRAVNGQLHVYWRDTSNNLKVDVIDPADVYNTIGTPITLSSAASGAFDVALMGTNALVAFTATGAGNPVTVLKINSAATILTTRTTGRNATGGYVAVAYHATVDKISLVRADLIANDEIRHDWLKNDLADDTTVNTLVQSEGTGTVENVTTVVLAGQNARVFWDIKVTHPTYDQVRRAAVTSSGGVTVKVLARRSQLGSRAILWTDGTAERVLVHVLHGSPQQPCYILLDADNVVGDTNGTTASGEEVGIVARLLPQEGPGDNLFLNGALPQIEDLGSNQFGCALTFRRRLVATGGDKYAERGIRDVVYTVNNSKAYRGVQEGRTFYLPGGYLAQYSGKRVVESGFFLFTEGVTGVGADTGGRLGSGKYNYRLYWEWRNDAGEIERSSHAGSVEVDLTSFTGTDNKVTLTVPTLPYTNKDNVYLAVYRTEVGGTTYYRASSVDPTKTTFKKNNINADSITWIDDNTDGLTDANLIKEELDYLNGQELDNIAPPATDLVAAGQARIFTRDPEDRSLLHHSKLRLDGDAVMFNDALTIRVPQEGGDVTALDVTEGGLIIFKESAIYAVSGQGPDNNGVGLYPSPQKIAEVGCDEVRSVVRTPKGVIFHSKKGFYLLDIAYQVHFIGAAVEDVDPDVVGAKVGGAVHLPDKHRVHIYTDQDATSGSLCYDYLLGEWSVWPALNGDSAVIWKDDPIYLVLPSGAPRKPQTTFADGSTAYSILLATGWIRVADLQGAQKVWSVEILGEYRSAHDLQVKVWYDYSDTGAAVDTFTWTATPTTVGGPERLKVGLSRPSAESFKIQITDVLAAAGEGLKLTGLSIEFGVRPGVVYKLPAAQTK